MAKKSSSGAVVSVVMIVILIALGLAWVRANNINNPITFVQYVRTKSAVASKCSDSGNLWFRCFWSSKPLVDDKGNVFPGKIPNFNHSNSDAKKSEPKPVASSDKQAYLAKISKIKIGNADSVKYSRKEWPHWIKQSNGCTTRDNVLISSGKNIKKKGKCRVIGGEWKDWYSGKTITNAHQIDIDHIIPLKYAAEHGGQKWTKAQKQQYANDTSTVLIAVSSRENRIKGAKGPSEYMPSDKSFWCKYAQDWINVSIKYNITASKADVAKLREAINTCK